MTRRNFVKGYYSSLEQITVKHGFQVIPKKVQNTSYSTEGPWVVKHSHLRSVFTPPSQIYIHAFLFGIYTITLCIKVHTVHIRSLGQLLDCQAVHSPCLRNIHTIKEPLFEEKPRPAQFHRDYVAISCHAHQENFGEWS